MSGAEIFNGPNSIARRDLRREEMIQSIGDIAWLQDHSLIPERAIQFDRQKCGDDPYANLAQWMVNRLVDWSSSAHRKLDYASIFEKHGIAPEDRVKIRSLISDWAVESFSPGMAATAEIFAAVPHVAAQEGASQDSWPDIASKARIFGSLMARDGTQVQGLVRGYLKAPGWGGTLLSADPTKLRLDSETGITTVTPFEDVLAAAKMVIDLTEDEYSEVSCLALQVRPSALGGESVYDAVWDAFGSAVERFIYPHIKKEELIHGRQEPDNFLLENMHAEAAEFRNVLDAYNPKSIF